MNKNDLQVFDLNIDDEDMLEEVAEETVEKTESAEEMESVENAITEDSAEDSDEMPVEESGPESTEEDAEEKRYGVIAEILSWVLTVLVAVLIAVFLKNFVIINATIPSGSMENTILKEDDLFGFRLAYMFKEPERGDIIIFQYPDNESEKYIKRIIGLPGEKVTISEGKIYINDSTEPLDEPYLKEEWTYMNSNMVFEVPENSYFVMGDNRNRSWDSRFWNNTYVSREQIIGKAGFRYYPFNRWGKVE